MAGLVLGLGLIAGTLPGYRTFRAWRAQDLAHDAVSELASGDLERAHELAAASLQLDPYAVDTRRLFAQQFAEEAQETALVHAHAVSHHPEARPEDYRRYVSQCLDANLRANSAGALKQLLTVEPDLALNWVLAGEYERVRGHQQPALDHVERALQLDPDLPAARLLGALLAAEGSDPTLREAGQQRLLALGRRDDVVGLRALGALSEMELHPATMAAPVVTGLFTHPLADHGHHLAAERLRYLSESNPNARRRILDDVLQRYHEAEPYLLYAWMNRCGETAEVLKRVSEEDIVRNRPLFLVYAQALLAEGKATTLLEWLDPPEKPWPIRTSTRLLLALEAAQHSGAAPRAHRLWEQLRDEAGRVNPPISLIDLAQGLEQKGFYHEAILTLEHVLERYPGESTLVYDRLLHLHRQRGDTPALLALTRRFLDAEPENPIYQHNWAYLAILTSSEIPEAESLLTELVNRHRLVPSICLLAWQKAQAGDIVTAESMVAPLEWDALSGLDQRLIRRLMTRHHHLPSPKALPFALLPEEQALFESRTASAPMLD